MFSEYNMLAEYNNVIYLNDDDYMEDVLFFGEMFHLVCSATIILLICIFE
jgi:hypothetical protein